MTFVLQRGLQAIQMVPQPLCSRERHLPSRTQIKEWPRTQIKKMTQDTGHRSKEWPRTQIKRMAQDTDKESVVNK